MNKYIYLIIAMVAILGIGIAYKNFGADKSKAALTTGAVKEITIKAQKNKWNWSPEDITVNQGDLVKLTIINEDEYDHGIAIDAYGISQRVPALGTIEAEFVATQPGDFPFYCSVPCGEGEVDGKKRGHFDQVGKIHVTHMMMNGTTMSPMDGMMGGAVPGAMKREASWVEIVAAITAGRTASIAQTHDMQVTLTMKDGTILHSTEPKIDAVLEEKTKCGADCADINISTE